MIALLLVLAQAAEVVFVMRGTDLEEDVVAELQLADPSLVVARQEAGPDWSGLSAGQQRDLVRAWVRERESDAAVWLTDPPEVHVWVPSEDRDLSVSVRASTEGPAGELAMVALRHLASMGWTEPSAEPPIVPAHEPVSSNPGLEAIRAFREGAGPHFVDAFALSAGVEASGDVGPDGAGPRLGARFRVTGEAGVVVPWVELDGRLGVVDRTALELRGDVEVGLGAGVWARWKGLGPTLGLRGSRRGLGWTDEGPEQTAWWDAAVVPGVRFQPGWRNLRPVVWGEVPIGLRDRVWRGDQGVALRISAVQWAAGVGLSGVFRKVDGV